MGTSYPYGMQGSPVVGNGLGGLPRRKDTVASAVADLFKLRVPKFYNTSAPPSSSVTGTATIPLCFDDNSFFVLGSTNANSLLFTFNPAGNSLSSVSASYTGTYADDLYILNPGNGYIYSPVNFKYVQKTGATTCAFGAVTGATGIHIGGAIIDGVVYGFTSTGQIFKVNGSSAIVLNTVSVPGGGTNDVAKIVKTSFGYALIHAIASSALTVRVSTFNPDWSLIATSANVGIIGGGATDYKVLGLAVTNDGAVAMAAPQTASSGSLFAGVAFNANGTHRFEASQNNAEPYRGVSGIQVEVSKAFYTGIQASASTIPGGINGLLSAGYGNLTTNQSTGMPFCLYKLKSTVDFENDVSGTRLVIGRAAITYPVFHDFAMQSATTKAVMIPINGMSFAASELYNSNIIVKVFTASEWKEV